MEQYIIAHEIMIKIIIDTLIAIGTIGAIIVALFLARAERAVKLRIRIATIPHDFQDPRKSLNDGKATLKIIILNNGVQAANLKSALIRWHIPFYKGLLFTKFEKNEEKIIISGKNGASFNTIELAEFRDEIRKFSENLKFFKSIRIKFLKAYLLTEEEVFYKIKLAPILHKELRVIAEQIKPA